MILASLKPYYYYLIGERKKTIEVRKTALKNLPQDIAFYMSKDEKSFAKIPKEFQEKYRKHFGKVGMKVVCNDVDKIIPDYQFGYLDYLALGDTYLSIEQIQSYGKGKTLYGWHITDLKIYDKPKELSEFISPSKAKKCVDYCINGICSNLGYEELCGAIRRCEYKKITRPPQSYMFVEEVEQ